MYTKVQFRIVLSHRSLVSLFDSSKSSVRIGIALFLSQKSITVVCFKLPEKQTLLRHIYSAEINTDPVTYPIDAHQRWRSTPMLSHILRGRTQAPCPCIRAYIPCCLQNTQKYQVFLYQIKYKNITIKYWAAKEKEAVMNYRCMLELNNSVPNRRVQQLYSQDQSQEMIDQAERQGTSARQTLENI